MTHINLTQLQELRLTYQSCRLAFVSGNFNVVHPGHIRLLKYARSISDILIVALLPDSTDAYVPQELRLAAMRSLEMVDQAFIILDSVKSCIAALRPDVVVKGAEHESNFNPEEEWLKEWGGKLVFCTNDPRFSLEDMLQGMFKGIGSLTTPIPRDYLERHDIAYDSFAFLLEKMSSVNVCVIGDIIVDEYVICSPLGMSREDPTIVVSPMEETRFVGGAGIVAGHAAGLGGKVELITVTGDDEAARYSEEWLSSNNIIGHTIVDPDRPTTIKRRYKANGKTLLRINKLSQQQIDHDKQKKILQKVNSILPTTNLLVFSDFSYGALPAQLVSRITQECIRHNVLMAADSQTSSQVGDLAKFSNTVLMTPTELEARHATHNFNHGLVAIAEDLRTRTKTKNVIITLGEDGCLIYGDPKESVIFTDQLPAINRRPIDVAGAGDSLLTASSLALAAGSSIWQAALLGTIAASIQVGRLGNTPLTTGELASFASTIRSGNTVVHQHRVDAE